MSKSTGFFHLSGASMKRLISFMFSVFLIVLGFILLFVVDVKGNNLILLQQIISGSFLLIGSLLGFSTIEKFNKTDKKENVAEN